MITVEQATEYVAQYAWPKVPQSVPLEDALNRFLAEDIFSDLDVPPNDQSLVDGYAVRATDFSQRVFREKGVEGGVELEVVEEVTAGNVPASRVESGRAVRVMTGVRVPDGADAVVMVEESTWQRETGLPLGVVHFNTREVVAGQNIMPRATSVRYGQLVLSCGKRIRPAEIAVLAQVGRTDVKVFGRPQVAVLPTGNELVDGGFVPGPGKIRNTNGPMLIACGRQLDADVLDLGIGRDEPQQLRNLIERGLSADVLVLSGGVSAGTLDLVPAVLEELKVRQVFHKVSMKPGKPLWFGIAGGNKDDSNDDRSTLVFGLPGNPVSSFVCFHLFVRPAIRRLCGQAAGEAAAPKCSALLAHPFEVTTDRATYHPAWIDWSETGPTIAPVLWHGSGDSRGLADANALAIFPEGARYYEAGQRIFCHPLD